MPVLHCAWGTCTNDDRRKHKEHMQGVEFFTFPRPVIEDSCHPQTIFACNEWIKMCGRPHAEFNINISLWDKVKRHEITI